MSDFDRLYKELMEEIWQPKVTIPLGIKRDKKDSPFQKDNPKIREFAMSSPDNLAMVFGFVFYTMQTPWAEVLHGFPKFIEWFYKDAVVRKGNRLMVNRNAKPPSHIGHTMTGQHKETGLATQRMSFFYDVYDNRHEIYENVVKNIDDVFELFNYVTTIKGLAKAKAAFVVQLISGNLGCFDSINVKSYDVTGLKMGSPARNEHGKLTKGGMKNLEDYIEYSNPMAQELWDDWCKIVEHKFSLAGRYSSEEKKRDEHKVIATKKGDVVKNQVAYSPNSRTKERLDDYTNKRLEGSKMDGRNVSRDHYTIFKDIEPFIKKESIKKISFAEFFKLFLEGQNDLKIYNSIVRLPPNRPYGFWVDKHGNFAVVKGGMGAHEEVGEQILKSLGVMKRRSTYDTLFSLGWVRVLIIQGKTKYEAGIGQRLTTIQKRNLDFINDYYDLKGVEEG